MNSHFSRQVMFCLQCSLQRKSLLPKQWVLNIPSLKRISYQLPSLYYSQLCKQNDPDIMERFSSPWHLSIRNESRESHFTSNDHMIEKDLEQVARQSYSRYKKYTSRLTEEVENKNDVTEEEPDEADMFGTLSNKIFFKESDTSMASLELTVDENERDWKRERRRKNTPYWYATQMKKFVREGKLAEAIDLLENRMLKEDKVTPIEYNYDVLIGACGRAGYTKKAFQLYNRMKERMLHPSNVTYTSLFNACAESPWPTADGYERLKKLHQYLLDKEIKVNLITHHSMIKAYGKCGDIEGAFHLFHHLLSSGSVVNRSFVAILMACASNKEAGFTFAIEAWRQMIARGLQPDEFCFNLLLRVVRDCGIGDLEIASKILLKPVPDAPLLDAPGTKKGKRMTRGTRSGGVQEDSQRGIGTDGKKLEEMILLEPASIKDFSKDLTGPTFNGKGLEEHEDGVTEPRDLLKEEGLGRTITKSESDDNSQKWWKDSGKGDNVAMTMQEESLSLDNEYAFGVRFSTLPNLLDQNADFKNVESLTNVETASDRLMLLGGLEGIVQQMKKSKVMPNVKTLSLLTDLVPMTTEDEDILMALVTKLNVSVDVDFYNMIIHRRTKREDLINAKNILPIIHEAGLYPNLRTFANLAIECIRMDDGLQLLKDMEGFSIKPNVVVYGALMKAAFRRRNFDYLIKLMQHMKETGIKPNERIIQLLEVAASFGSRAPADKKPKPYIQRRVNRFKGYYYEWLSKMEATEEPHPWAEYDIKTKTQDTKEETSV